MGKQEVKHKHLLNMAYANLAIGIPIMFISIELQILGLFMLFTSRALNNAYKDFNIIPKEVTHF